MIWWYRFFFLPVLILTAPRYLLRMRRRGGYGENFSQRFGNFSSWPEKSPGSFRVWIQAVSVGEIIAVGPLLKQFQRLGFQVFLTTTTSTGYRLALERYRDTVMRVGYFPLDWWWFSARAWKRIAPDISILVEGERWPEHLHQGVKHGVPVIAVNARISERSFSRWARVPAWARGNLRNLAGILCAGTVDHDRFLALGADPRVLYVTGNLKLDVAVPRLDDSQLLILRQSLGFPRGDIVVGASTWPGEEETLLTALAKARSAGLDTRLLLVPRHAERREEISALLATTAFRWQLRSGGPAAGELDVLVADTTGELRQLLQVGSVVFVGKSLAPHTEGQTPVEAAALGLPVLFGPGMKNFSEIAQALQNRGAAEMVSDSTALSEKVVQILRDPVRRKGLAVAALEWHRGTAGALQRTVDILQARYLPPAVAAEK